MFVRIIIWEEKVGEGKSLDSIYECSRVFIRAILPESVNFCMEKMNEYGAIDVEVEKAKSEVYIMNDRGHTIEKYVWQ